MSIRNRTHIKSAHPLLSLWTMSILEVVLRDAPSDVQSISDPRLDVDFLLEKYRHSAVRLVRALQVQAQWSTLKVKTMLKRPIHLYLLKRRSV